MGFLCPLRALTLAVRSRSVSRGQGPPPCLHQLDAVVLQRDRAEALTGRVEKRVQHRRRGHADRRLADPAPDLAGGHEDRFHLGICVIRIESKLWKFSCTMRPSLTVHSSKNSADKP